MPIDYPFISGVPFLPGQEPAGQPMPMQPTGMPIAQAGMDQAQAPAADPMTALLTQLLSQPMPAANPRLAQMQAFMQMQQGNPGRGPFTSIVNPIVNALMARQVAPQLQQQQQSALALQRLKLLQTVAAIQGTGLKTDLTKATIKEKLGKIQAAEEAYKPTLEEQQAKYTALATQAEIAAGRAAETSAHNVATEGMAGRTFTLRQQTEHRQAENQLQEMQNRMDRANLSHDDRVAAQEALKTYRDVMTRNAEIGTRQKERMVTVAETAESRKEAEQPSLVAMHDALRLHYDSLNKTEEGRQQLAGIGALRMAAMAIPKGGDRDKFMRTTVLPALQKAGLQVDVTKPTWGEFFKSFFSTDPYGDSAPLPTPGTTPAPAGAPRTSLMPSGAGTGGTGAGMARTTPAPGAPYQPPPGVTADEAQAAAAAGYDPANPSEMAIFRSLKR